MSPNENGRTSPAGQHGHTVRKRFWFEVLAGTTGLILLIASRVSKEWIEVVFGVDPDGGNGLLENAIALALLGTALVSFAFARREFVHARRARAEWIV